MLMGGGGGGVGSSRNANWEGAVRGGEKKIGSLLPGWNVGLFFFFALVRGSSGVSSTALIHLSNNYQTPPKVQLAQVLQDSIP